MQWKCQNPVDAEEGGDGDGPSSFNMPAEAERNHAFMAVLVPLTKPPYFRARTFALLRVMTLLDISSSHGPSMSIFNMDRLGFPCGSRRLPCNFGFHPPGAVSSGAESGILIIEILGAVTH